MDKISKIHLNLTKIGLAQEFANNAIISTPLSLKGITNGTTIPGTVTRVGSDGLFAIRTSLGEVVLQSNRTFTIGNKLYLQPNQLSDGFDIKVFLVSAEASDAPLKEVVNQEILNKLNFLIFRLPHKLAINNELSLTTQKTVDAAFDLSLKQNQQFINSILISSKTANLSTIFQSTLASDSIRKLTNQDFKNIDELLRSGSKVDFRLLKILSERDSVDDISLDESGRLLISGKIFSNSKFQEAVLKTILGDFTFSNIDLDFEDQAKVLLELVRIQNSILDISQELKLSDINELLKFLENLENSPVIQLINQSNSESIFKFDINASDNIFFIVNLAKTLFKLTSDKKPNFDVNEKNPLSNINVASKILFEESLKMPWQVFFTPILDGDTLQFVKFFIKKTPEDQAIVTNNKRFIVELNTFAFGKIVIDGFLSNVGERSSLNMNLKTQDILDNETETELRTLFSDVLESQGYQGSIVFSKLENYTSPLVENIRFYCLNKAKAVLA